MSVAARKKVLIVDDEADICFLFDRILEKRNLKAGHAFNLAEARESLRNEVPSLIFLDNFLPDGQGMDFIPFIKEHYPQTQVVIVTANDSISERSRAFQMGADGFFSKPLCLKLIHLSLDNMKDSEPSV